MQQAGHNPNPERSRVLASEQLLFGIIALQNNFVTREQFIAAFDSWVQDKSRTLVEILQQQQALSADDSDLLARLVAKFLTQHSGDPEKSLAALGPIPQVRPELERLQDADLQASLGHIGQYVTPDPRLQPTLPVPVTTERSLGRYRVLRPHAKGGLGQVSVALDQELQREVALKEIQIRFADDAQTRSRFVLEAEITGGLEHPGIVPVYGLSRTDDGRPLRHAVYQRQQPERGDRSLSRRRLNAARPGPATV